MDGLLAELDADRLKRAQRRPRLLGVQAPLASIRIAICGPANARTAARRPASSPIPTFTFTVRKPAARAWAASWAAPERSIASIVRLTAIGARRRRRRAAARPARTAPAGEVPEREVDRGERLGDDGPLAAAGDDVGDRRVAGVVGEHRPAGVDLLDHLGDPDPVVGVKRRGLAVAGEPVAGLQRDEHSSRSLTAPWAARCPVPRSVRETVRTASLTG